MYLLGILLTIFCMNGCQKNNNTSLDCAGKLNGNAVINQCDVCSDGASVCVVSDGQSYYQAVEYSEPDGPEGCSYYCDGAYLGGNYLLPNLPAAETIILKPDFSKYSDKKTDDFWVNQSTGQGKKFFESWTYATREIEIGMTEFNFTGGVVSNTLDKSYQAFAYTELICGDNSDEIFACESLETIDRRQFRRTMKPLVANQNFKITIPDVPALMANGYRRISYGYRVTGLIANSDNESILGSVVIVNKV